MSTRMKTRGLVFLSITVILFTCVFGLSACNRPDNGTDVNDVPAKRGDFYTIREAYDNGIITLEDLKNIAYYQNIIYGYQNGDIEDESFVPSPKNPEQLSAETEWAIKQTRAYDLRNDEISPREDAIPSQQDIYRYYGVYNDYVAVMVYGGWFTSYWDEEIYGVVFHGWKGEHTIMIWKSNGQ